MSGRTALLQRAVVPIQEYGARKSARLSGSRPGNFDQVTTGNRPWRVLTREDPSLTALLAIAVLLTSFALIVRQVAKGKPLALDRRITYALRSSEHPPRPIGPPWVQEAARDLTSLGSIIVVTVTTAAVAGYLVLAHKPGVAWLMVLAIAGGIGLNNLLKLLFRRPRPDVVTPAARVFTTSFPSGHATLSAIAYLTIAALLSRAFPSTTLGVYFMVVAVSLTVLVGFSRIYLGVHYPTDVLGGWCIGAAWAIFCWVLMAWLQTQGRIELSAIPLGATSKFAT
jgi:undecaprenyl-diphosphatase